MKTAWMAALLTLCVGWMGAAGAYDAPENESIWPRIADGMRIVDPEQPDTVMWARRYARQPAAFAAMLARSEPFLWYIVEAVELREMPLELALLPAVESGFDPKARSAAKARGLWQFVPWTGRALGLSRTANYDARNDPVASTRAALGYLQDLNDRFDDWLLAVAAYNVGDARLASALRRQEGSRFWDLADLPRETREHVPRLLGVALLVKQPERFGVVLPEIANRQAAELVRLPRAINLEQAAQDARIADDLLEHYNPGLKDAANTSGKKVVLLPPAEASRLREVLAASQYPPEPMAQTVEHVVRPGDSLWSIARRYQVSVRELRSWNDLGTKAVLRPGRRLQLRIES
ncbi:MAG TPA: transglycosylase SLT domain-containing protein [Solimonas sp.]|nr:transglycosylase SLT domain-containing protein [Solimonas sp.]